MAGNRPDSGDVHVNALLTNLSIAYLNDEYVADRVFPVVMVNKQSDIIPTYDKAFWFRDEMAERAPGTKARESGWAVDNTNTFFCASYALSKIIPDEVRLNADAPYNMDRDAVTYLTDKAMLHRERKFATAINSASAWTTTGTAATKWSDFANSDPIDDILTTKRDIRALIGRDPTTFIVGNIVIDRLRRHPDFMDLIKYTQRGLVTEEIIAQVLGLKKVFICKSVYESAVEGASTNMLNIWDDDAVLVYVPAAPSLLAPAGGYQFVWRPLAGGGVQYIRRFRMEAESSDVVEVRSYFEIKVTSGDAGAHWADVVD